MRRASPNFLPTCAFLTIALAMAATADDTIEDYVPVTDFADEVVDEGGEEEDWQPAFQAAVDRARKTRRPLYVPAGEYPIRRAIDIVPPTVDGTPFVRNNLRMFGAGRFKTFIRQQVETENCINWTGPEYENGAMHGHLSGMTLSGGATTLNIKWHNYFTVEDCYIVAAAKRGIHAEGWSSRFRNCIVRWCRGPALYAGGHFNNCVIRDCYFSRNVIGIEFAGVHGSRVESCGFESCARAAILVRNTHGLSICDSYFEGNGRRVPKHLPFDDSLSANTVHLDIRCHAIRIHDCIFRKNIDDAGGLISIADCRGGHIYDNYFYNYNAGGIGVILRKASQTAPETPTAIHDLTFERNWQHQLSAPITEDTPGLYETALQHNCSFGWQLAETHQ